MRFSMNAMNITSIFLILFWNIKSFYLYTGSEAHTGFSTYEMGLEKMCFSMFIIWTGIIFSDLKEFFVMSLR